MFENKDANRSLLIPKWYSIIDIGRFDYASVENTQYRIDQKTRDLMLNDYHDFLLSPTLTKAADLLNSAIILNDKEIASEVSNFINLNPLSSSSMKSLSNRVLNGTSSSTVDNSLSSSDKIRAVKHQLVDQERNALLWIELARLYSMKGLYRKATKASLVAINLAPTNRFIVRSSVRFFIHTGDLDEAYTISKKAFEQTNDPWIRSTFINCSILVDMKLKNIPMLNIDEINNNKLFHFSELLSSSAMLDIRLGNGKRAKKLLQQAWLNPSEVVVAHAEWFLRNEYKLHINPGNLDFSKSAEASTWKYYYSLDIEHALENSYFWSLEEPYSTHPFTTGSFIACSANRFTDAIKFAKEGLISNPNDQLLKNNLIFALLKNGNILEAENLLNEINFNSLIDKDFYLFATLGLYCYLKGDFNLGRNLYSKALSLSKILDNDSDSIKVLLNYALAEVSLPQDIRQKKIIDIALKSSEGNILPGVILLRNLLNLKLSQPILF